jgi:hypothetical protein
MAWESTAGAAAAWGETAAAPTASSKTIGASSPDRETRFRNIANTSIISIISLESTKHDLEHAIVMGTGRSPPVGVVSEQIQCSVWSLKDVPEST